jgi:hypothetical protein
MADHYNELDAIYRSPFERANPAWALGARRVLKEGGLASMGDDRRLRHPFIALRDRNRRFALSLPARSAPTRPAQSATGFSLSLRFEQAVAPAPCCHSRDDQLRKP